MTAIIHEISGRAIVKDLYFTSPVAVQEYVPKIEDFKIFSMEEEDAKSWIIKDHQLWKKIRYQTWFDEYKRQTFRCVICKINNPTILDFHHLDSNKKKYSIPTMINQCMRLREIQAELKKCVVVCSNCHRRITDNSISKEEVMEKAKEEYRDSERPRPGEKIIKEFLNFMLCQMGPIILYKYDEDYVKSYRVLQNLVGSYGDDRLRRHPDYINFCRKRIVGRESDYDLGLDDDDELGEFRKGWLKEC
jgi:hypothetical protein